MLCPASYPTFTNYDNGTIPFTSNILAHAQPHIIF